MLRHNEKATLKSQGFFKKYSYITFANGIKATCIRQSLAVLQEKQSSHLFLHEEMPEIL